MKDLGELKYFLGIQLERTGDIISMSQKDYIEKILKRFGMEDCKPRCTPCEMDPNAYANDYNQPVDQHNYRQMVGSLIYAMVCTRPDLSYAVTKLSQHLSCPTTGDAQMIKHVFRYLKKTSSYQLTYTKSDDLEITAYYDADWAVSKEDRRSISGYCLSLNRSGLPILWKLKRQNSVALSTCEAEYVSMSLLCQEIIYSKNNLAPDILNEDLHTSIFCDNQGALALAKSPSKHSKTKNIDIRYHFVREFYQNNKVDLKFVNLRRNFYYKNSLRTFLVPNNRQVGLLIF